MPNLGHPFHCALCGERSLAEKPYSEHFGVCHLCAEAVANMFSMAHGGQWLTWPNSASKPKPKPVISPVMRWQVFREDGFACRNCGETGKPLHVDHIIPSSRGGGNGHENLQTLCETCNTSKGAR